MLHFVKGDMLQSTAQALVNTVNTVGVMGKGIALQFKEAFPNNNKVYIKACKNNELKPGKLLSFWDTSNLLTGEKLIINFPTKIHWRSPSQYDYIKKGLESLRQLIQAEGITSIALPPLGCGNGGLDWAIVKPMIINSLSDLNTEIYIYEPDERIKEVLQKQDNNKRISLTPARAQLLYLLFAYESFGEYSSLFAANKLAYFLQRIGQPLKLKFTKHHYGPYAIGVEKVLYMLNGVYLLGLEQGQAKPFEPLRLNYKKWDDVASYVEKELKADELSRLKDLLYFIKDFTSELPLEVLATVDYILQENPSYKVDEVINAISEWSNRKGELFNVNFVTIAYNHLQSYKNALMLH